MPDNSSVFKPINHAVQLMQKDINISLLLNEDEDIITDIEFIWELVSCKNTSRKFDEENKLLFQTIDYIGIVEDVSIRFIQLFDNFNFHT